MIAMSTLTTELNRLHDRILAADPDMRCRYHEALDALIDRMDAVGEPVPAGLRDLAEELRADAIERQFENVPV